MRNIRKKNKTTLISIIVRKQQINIKVIRFLLITIITTTTIFFVKTINNDQFINNRRNIRCIINRKIAFIFFHNIKTQIFNNVFNRY